MVIAYLRVSTEKQHLSNQREEIERYASANGLNVNLWITAIVSGKENYKFDDSINSKVLCFAFGLVAEIERNAHIARKLGVSSETLRQYFMSKSDVRDEARGWVTH